MPLPPRDYITKSSIACSDPKASSSLPFKPTPTLALWIDASRDVRTCAVSHNRHCHLILYSGVYCFPDLKLVSVRQKELCCSSCRWRGGRLCVDLCDRLASIPHLEKTSSASMARPYGRRELPGMATVHCQPPPRDRIQARLGLCCRLRQFPQMIFVDDAPVDRFRSVPPPVKAQRFCDHQHDQVWKSRLQTQVRHRQGLCHRCRQLQI